MGASIFKYGCMGCAGLVGLLLLAAVVVVGFASLSVRSASSEERVFTHELEPAGGVAPPATQAPDGAAIERELVAELIRVDLRHGEFTVEPAAAGQALRVEARYDPAQYVLEERSEPAADGTPRYELSFRRTGSGLFAAVKQMLGGETPSVRVLLPVDRPFDLDLSVGEGEGRIDLGGMWLRQADLRFDKCAVDLEFAAPLREPMQRLAIEASMGGFAIGGVANASPRSLDVDYSMAGMELDLRGPWRADAEISINGRMAGGAVRLPRDVFIEGISGGRWGLGERGEVEAPTLRFSVSSDESGKMEFTH